MGKKDAKEKLLKKKKDDTDSSDDESEKEPDHKDHKADKRVVDGPVKERKVTDFMCCVVFIATIILCLFLSIKGYSAG